MNWCMERSPHFSTVQVNVMDSWGSNFSGSGWDEVSPRNWDDDEDSGEGAFNGTGSVAATSLGFVEYSLCRVLRRTPRRRYSWTEMVGGREGRGIMRLRNFGGSPVLRNNREGSIFGVTKEDAKSSCLVQRSKANSHRDGQVKGR